HDNPMPLLPPVTSTTLPSRSSFTCWPPSPTGWGDYRCLAVPWQPSACARKQIRQRDTAEDRGADPVVVAKRAKALLRVAVADQRVWVHTQRKSAQRPRTVGPRELKSPANARHER